MADEEKTEEVVEEVTEEVVEETTEEETTEAAEEKAEDSMKDFDDKIESDDDDSADDDDGEEKDDPAEEEVEEEKEVTVPDDSMDAAADALEAEIETEAAKSDEQKATEAAEAKVKADEEAEAAKASEEKPFDCGLSVDPDDEDAFDPKLVEILNKQGQAQQDRAVKAEAENGKLYAEIDRQDALRHADWLDRQVEKLGEDFVEVLGDGEFDDLVPGSDQRANRIAVSNRMGVTMRAYLNAKQAVPTKSKLFKMAVNKLFNKETNKSKTETETVKKVKKRANQVLGQGSKKATTVSAAESNAKKQSAFDAKIDE